MASDNTLTFTDENFEAEVLKSDQPVLVDFWAEWCQPCRMLGPTIDELAGEYDGKARIGKFDIESGTATPSKYGVSSIPTVLVFKNGEVVKQFIGIRPKADFAAALDGAN